MTMDEKRKSPLFPDKAYEECKKEKEVKKKQKRNGVIVGESKQIS